jgi:hypothetical protein
MANEVSREAAEYAHYTAKATISLLVGGTRDNPGKIDDLAKYMLAWPRDLEKPEDVIDFTRLLTEARYKRLIYPKDRKTNNARRRRIFDYDEGFNFFDANEISSDNPDIEEIIEEMRKDATEQTDLQDQNQSLRLVRRVEETIAEDEFLQAKEILDWAKIMDAGVGKISTLLTDQDIKRVIEIIAKEESQQLSADDLRIIHLILIDSRQLAIMSSVYRKWTPIQLAEKLSKLEIKMMQHGIIGSTQNRTTAVLSGMFMGSMPNIQSR